MNKLLFTFGFLFVYLVTCFTSVAQHHTTVGTDFWFGFMQNAKSTSNETLYIYVGSDFTTTGTLTIPTTGYTQTFTVTANQTTQLTLPNSIAEHYSSHTVQNRGIHIETAAPCYVSYINRELFSTDGTSVMDVNSLGSNYRITSYRGVYDSSPIASTMKSEFLIVATADNTQIEIISTTGTVGGLAAGVPDTITLQAGQSYQVKALGQTDDLTGTTIRGIAANGSCRPFAVFSGTQMTFVPNNCQWADHLVTQCKPIENWDKEFLVVPFHPTTSYRIKVLADQNNTQISINGVPVTTLNAGAFYEQSFGSSTPLCISSNKNISVTQFMQGNDCYGNYGDPAMIDLNGKSQWLNKVVFYALNLPSPSEQKLTIVARTLYTSELELDGQSIAANLFTPFSNCAEFSYATVDVAIGSHTLSAPHGFQAYLYSIGFNTDESYALSLGGFTVDPQSTFATPIPDAQTLICALDTVSIGGNFNLTDTWWSTALSPEDTIFANSTYYSAYPSGSETYILHGTNAATGCASEYNYLVANNAGVQVDILAQPDSICVFTNTELSTVIDSSGTFSYQWYPEFGLSDPSILNPTLLPMNSEHYVLQVFNEVGCLIGKDSVDIISAEGYATSIRINEPYTFQCLGDSTTFDVSLEQVYFTEEFEGAMPGFEFATVSNASITTDCISGSGSVLSFNGGGSRYITTTNLDLTGGGHLAFSLMAPSGSGNCDVPEFGDNLQLEYSLDNGTSWTHISTFEGWNYSSWTHVNLVIPTAAENNNVLLRWSQTNHDGSNLDIWQMDHVRLTTFISSGFEVTWSPSTDLIESNQGINLTVFPDTTTVYYVSYLDTVSQCIHTDSVTITVVPDFDLTVSPDISICSVDGTPLSATETSLSPVSFDWSPAQFLSNPTAQTLIASPTSTTTFHLTATSQEGCKRRDSVLVSVLALNHFNVLPESDTICFGESVQSSLFIAPAGCTTGIEDCGGASLGTIVGPYTGGGSGLGNTPFPAYRSTRSQYVVTAAEMNSYGISGPQLIQYLALQVIGINYTYNTGIYEQVTIKMGCFGEDTLTTDFVPDLETVLDPVTYEFFVGWDTLHFDRGYRWDGTSNLLIEFCYENPIQFSIGIATANIYHPGMSLYNNGTNQCEALSGTSYDRVPRFMFGHCPLVANTDLEYAWTPANTISSDTVSDPVLYPDNSTTYYLTATDPTLGCVYIDSVYVHVIPNTSDALIPVDAYPLCAGDSVSIEVQTSSSTISWNNSSTLSDSTGTTPWASPNVTTTYVVQTTNNGICFSSDSVVVEVFALPAPQLGNDTSICQGSNLLIGTPAIATYSYSWTSGLVPDSSVANQIITPLTSDWYTLEVADTNGCAGQDSLFIAVLPVYQSTASLTICYGDSAYLEGAYQTMAGTYIDTLLSASNCDSIVETELLIQPQIPMVTIPSLAICSGDSILLFGTYHTQAGIYYDTLTANTGCDSIVQCTLALLPTSYTTLPDVHICNGDSALIHGNYEFSAGTYEHVLTGINGCDSTIAQQLYIHYPSSVHLNYLGPDTMCLGHAPVNLANGVPVGGVYSGPGVNNAFFDPAVAGIGTFYVVYTYTNNYGCVGADSTQVLVDACLGIDELNAASWDVFPNPFQHSFTIRAEKPVSSIQVALYSLNGEIVLKESYYGKQQFQVDVTTIVPGAYLLKVIMDGEEYTPKLLIRSE